jgi:hypothetical protein
MTDSTLPLADLLAKAGDGDFLRAVAETVVQLLMEADVEGVIGEFGIVGPRGGNTGQERTAIRGRPLPPTPKAGQR